MKKLILIILFTVFTWQVNAQNVTQEWVAIYNGPANNDDVPNSIEVDASGNVFVTGNSEGIGTGSDYITIKYNSSGDTLWVARYNGPGNLTDYALSIAIDEAGNVYITGMSIGSVKNFQNYDFATIKYNSNGVQQWVARYNGPGDGWDAAGSIAIDGVGNVYITGNSSSDNGDPDYATIKYNSDGVQQWVQRYNGPGNGLDAAKSIEVDASGNVYVTGYSEGIGTGSDYATIKYNSSGVEQWVQRYNGPANDGDGANSMEIDVSGNVYVTGGSRGSGTNYDFATIKYNSDGVQQWEERYNGPANNYDGANSIEVDATGNVYVTGESVGNGTFNDYATIKYNSNGVQQWAERYNGPGNGNDEPRAIIVDESGNVYVTGRSDPGGWSNDYATIKYNSNGVEQWVERYNGPGNSSDLVFAIAIDGNGNLYVTGASIGSGSNYDITTIKYSQGSPLVITKPTTNDKWMAGESDTIKWTGGLEGQFVIIEFSSDNGENYDIINISAPADSGYFVWKVTDTLLTTKAKVKLTDLFNPNIESESSTFSIKPYILTRIDNNGNYYEYRKNRDQWGFINDSNDMWPQTWWQQFNYQGIDPFTNSQYSQWQGDSVFNKMSAAPSVHVDWITWVNTFSVDACYWSTLLNIYKKSALLKWWSRIDWWGGSCFGIAAANALAFSFKEEFQIVYHNFPDSINPISVTSNNDVKKVVNELFSHQYGNPSRANDIPGSAKTPNQTLDDIKEMLKDDNSIASTLTIFNNGVGGGGHTILAYGLKRDPVLNHIYYIQVYDNSNPNSNNPITVNTQGNGGNGTWSTPDWAGWGGNKGLYLEIQADTYLNGAFFPDGLNSQSPFRLSENILEINYKSDSPIKIVDTHGNVTGFENNLVFNDIPGSLAMMVKNGSESPPYGYTLQTDNYSVILNEFESDTVNAFFFTGNKSFVLERKGAVQTETDKLFFDGGLSVTNPDAHIKTIKLLNLLDENTQEKFTVITGLNLAQNDSVKIENLDSNKIKLISYGTAKDYDLELSFLNESVSDRFIALNLNLPANSSHIIVPYWQDLMNTELMLLTDIGNNGIIDDTTFIDNVLPVDLISFNAIVDGRDVLLSWKTAWEVNNDRFEIFRKKLDDENTQWIKVGTIPGNGNTNEPVAYSFTDKNLTTGKYEYKLMQYDFNGISTADWDLNPIVEIGIPDRFDLNQNYPNPFNPITKIDFQIPIEGMVRLSIFDMSGREVATLVNEIKTPGYYQTEFNGSNFASGVYFYRLVTNNNVMTKKFMLLK